MLKFKLNSLFKIFQSNQSGIETCYYLSVQNISSPFQSNQSGIETCCQKKKPNNLKASNRTKVELKLWFQNTIRFTTFSLPIEPKWNWNGVFFFCMKIFPCFQSNQSGIETSDEYFFTKAAFPSNRTKVELKLKSNTPPAICCIFQSNQSGIETCWAVRHTRVKISSNRTKVELKRTIRRDTLDADAASNRTKVELKLQSFSIHSPSLHLPIEPKWNWNKQYIKFGNVPASSNRTKVELKQTIH